MQKFKNSYAGISFVLLVEVSVIIILQYIIIKQAEQWEVEKQMNTEKLKYISEDMVCFPIPVAYRNQVYFEDTYGEKRGDFYHEGCDIMDYENKEGLIPIVSATDGVITNIGWLYLGGYRIGITSKNGIYYYYAHLNSYAKGLSVGKEVKAGELLGFMGNTGEGEEGTTGKFNVHLHFAIYIFLQGENEKTVNPYPFLQKFEEE